MNYYNKLRRLLAKKLKLLSTKIEPKHTINELLRLKDYCEDITQDEYTIRLTKNGNSVILRKASSDTSVFEQIFIGEEYSDLVEIILLNNISIKTVLDLGANIGLTTVYLYNYFPDANFICAEPDENNFELMKQNTSGINNTILYQKAIWSTKNNIYLNRNFRDGKDWSISVSSDQSGSYARVDTMTIEDIIQGNNLSIVDILKIDIEGAEAEIFRSDEYLAFLKKTKVIAIEIHNEFNLQEVIVSKLKSNNFLLVDTKQTLLAFNLNYFQSYNSLIQKH